METVKLAALFIIFIMVFSAVASFIVMVMWTDKIEEESLNWWWYCEILKNKINNF